MVGSQKTIYLAVPVLALLFELLKWLWPQPDDKAPIRIVTRSRRRFVIITSLLMLSALSYYSIRHVWPNSVSASPVDRIASRGIVVVGVMYNSPPFGYKASETDAVQGFEPDIGKEIAKGIFNDPSKIRFVRTEGKNRLSLSYLQEHSVDIVISTFSINYEADKRQDIMAFSDPYYIAGQRIIALKRRNITRLSQLRGRPVCVGAGENEVNLRSAIPGVRVRAVKNTRTCLDALRKGSIDAISSDEYITLRMARQYDDLELKAQPLTSDPYGIAVPRVTKGYGDMVSFLNATLSNMKRDGRWKHIYEANIGRFSPDSPAVHSCG